MTSVWLTVICVLNLVLRIFFVSISVRLSLVSVPQCVHAKPVALKDVKIVCQPTVSAETRKAALNISNARN